MTRKDQYCLFNQKPFNIITCYTMDDNVGAKALNNLPQKSLDFIGVFVSSYCFIIKCL